MYILAVDDEQLALDSLMNELRIVFPNAYLHGERRAQEALEWAKELVDKQETISYAFLDIKIGYMTGLELAQRLKKFHPNMKLLFCTAHSQYAYDAYELYAKGYLLKPVQAKDIERVLNEMVKDWKEEPTNLTKDIRVQTFGYFDVFVDGVPLTFEREKAKELLAYLVDRHGASVTTEQIATVLWEEAAYNRKMKNMATTVVAALRNTLRVAGVEEILIKTWNHLSLDITKIKCDAYDFEKGDVTAINTFSGEYMSNYSWAEFTTGKYVSIKNEEINL